MKNLIFVLALSSVLMFCTDKKGMLPPKVTTPNFCDSIKYSTSIQPILDLNCAISGCHDGSSSSTPGVFTSYSNTIIKVNDSTFKNRAVTLHNMPAPMGLTSSDISKISCWLNKGAPNN